MFSSSIPKNRVHEEKYLQTTEDSFLDVFCPLDFPTFSPKDHSEILDKSQAFHIESFPIDVEPPS